MCNDVYSWSFSFLISGKTALVNPKLPVEIVTKLPNFSHDSNKVREMLHWFPIDDSITSKTFSHRKIFGSSCTRWHQRSMNSSCFPAPCLGLHIYWLVIYYYSLADCPVSFTRFNWHTMLLAMIDFLYRITLFQGTLLQIFLSLLDCRVK